MKLAVREMALEEVGLIIDYFHGAAPEYLEMLGVERTKLPAPEAWREIYAQEYERPVEERNFFLLIWLSDGQPIGFSTVNKIAFGEEAYMHLHIVTPELRKSGFGAECVRRSVDIYFERLKLKRLYCEPNAFNIAPNRTLQRAGFRYVMTHTPEPGWINTLQPLTRWIFTRGDD